MTPLDINILTEGVAAQLSPLAERQQVTIATNLATDFPIIRADGGSIWAQSEEGKGSTFSFSLPAKIENSEFNKTLTKP